jgi:hypothetical protein
MTLLNAWKVTIRTPNKGLRSINADDIDDRTKMKTSFMPTGLERTMTQPQFLDLVEYLLQRRSAPAK